MFQQDTKSEKKKERLAEFFRWDKNRSVEYLDEILRLSSVDKFSQKPSSKGKENEDGPNLR